ncbi:T9SS C-terminal target domain-containing protein [Bacteroidetes/Chlorobi group bacterium ChocPot_Mid]|nr:MAG: T9SS C-terminal target domain-containing protein [Bacteroidetes/Chlorobi group bacterium ChocPot_Mid]
MKRLNYLVAILLIAFTFSAFSQSITGIKANQKELKYLDNLYGKVIPADYSNPKAEKTQALTWENIVLNIQPVYFSLYSRSTPFVYDPISDIVMIAGVKYRYSSPTTLSQIFGEIYSKKPTAMRWDSVKIFNEADMGIANPSLAINNTTNATSVGTMNLTMLGRFAASSDSWRFSGVTYCIKTGTEVIPELSPYPDVNNPGSQYSWNIMNLKGTGNGPMSYAAGMLNVPMTPTVQYGAYGLLAINNTTQKATQSKLPTEWALSNFRASTDLQRSYNTPMEITVNKTSGNVYVAVNNIFADDENNRVPAVSSSTDQGATWSAFNRMPVSLLEDYKTSTGYELIGAYLPYNQMNGFVAWGDNNFSYVFPVFLASQDTIREIHLVEAKCINNTNWSLVKISELNGFLPWIFYASDTYPNAQDRFRITEAFLGYEIQASVTADGQYLVVKYIDQGLNQDGTGKVANFATPVPITVMNSNNEEVDATLGSLSILDIFIARRQINNNNWNVKNVTNDDVNYKATWIPPVVPAVDNIPVIWAPTAVYADQQNPFNQLPQPLRDRIVEFAFSYSYSRITEPMDVEETAGKYEFDLFGVYPNPVTDLVEFTFQLKEATNVRIEVTNALGQLVKVVYDNYTNEGLQGLNADLSDLSSGVYYYTLIAGNQRATRLMNIVR